MDFDPHEDAFRAFESAAWNRIPEVYDDFFGPITARAIDPLLDLAHVDRTTRLLDVASGPGRLAARASARGATATAVDLASAMLDLAGRLHPELERCAAAAEALPFHAGSFDVVTCNFGLGHFADPERALAEATRVTAPGGRVALSWWGSPGESRLIGVFHDALERAEAAPPPSLPPGPPFFQYADSGRLRALLLGAGFERPDLRRLEFTLPIPSGDALWNGVLSSSVRTAAVIRGQTEETRRRIRAIFDELVAGVDGEGEGLAIPVVIYLALGTRGA